MRPIFVFLINKQLTQTNVYLKNLFTKTNTHNHEY